MSCRAGRCCGPHVPVFLNVLWVGACGWCPVAPLAVDPIVFCINTRGVVHKGHLVSSLYSTAGMKSSNHSPSAHICSVVRQGRVLSLAELREVQFGPQVTKRSGLQWPSRAALDPPLQRWLFGLRSPWLCPLIKFYSFQQFMISYILGMV